MAAPKKKYPDELRERAVRLYRETHPRPVIRRLAEQLGVHHEALRNWHAVNHGGPVALDATQRVLAREVLEAGDGASRDQRSRDGQERASDVEEGQRGEDAVLGPHPHQLGHRRHVRQRGVAVPGALREAGRAGGLDEDDVIGRFDGGAGGGDC
nr:transposase [Pseudonocardia sp.]